MESPAFKAMNSFVPPSKPSRPEASSITMDSCILTWTRPVIDGGSEITNYIIQKRDRKGTRWIRANNKTCTECRYRVTGMPEEFTFEFQIMAENAAGPGEPSEPSSYVVFRDPVYPPSKLHYFLFFAFL